MGKNNIFVLWCILSKEFSAKSFDKLQETELQADSDKDQI